MASRTPAQAATPSAPAVSIRVDDPFSGPAQLLVRKQEEELIQRYGRSDGCDGAGLFAPEHVQPGTGAFLIAWLADRPVACGAIRPVDRSWVAEGESVDRATDVSPLPDAIAEVKRM